MFAEVCKLKRIIPETSQLGVPQTSGIIERTNQDIVVGTRTLLAQAGLPSCFWAFAAPRYCLMNNVARKANGGDSPWMMKFGEEFDGLKIPFGRKVTFVPSPTKGDKPGRWEPPTKTGAFAGYKMPPGGKWSGLHCV